MSLDCSEAVRGLGVWAPVRRGCPPRCSGTRPGGGGGGGVGRPPLRADKQRVLLAAPGLAGLAFFFVLFLVGWRGGGTGRAAARRRAAVARACAPAPPWTGRWAWRPGTRTYVEPYLDRLSPLRAVQFHVHPRWCFGHGAGCRLAACFPCFLLSFFVALTCSCVWGAGRLRVVCVWAG